MLVIFLYMEVLLFSNQKVPYMACKVSKPTSYKNAQIRISWDVGQQKCLFCSSLLTSLVCPSLAVPDQINTIRNHIRNFWCPRYFEANAFLNSHVDHVKPNKKCWIATQSKASYYYHYLGLNEMLLLKYTYTYQPACVKAWHLLEEVSLMLLSQLE